MTAPRERRACRVSALPSPWCAESLENREQCAIEFPRVRFCLLTGPCLPHKVARIREMFRLSVYNGSSAAPIPRFSRVNACKDGRNFIFQAWTEEEQRIFFEHFLTGAPNEQAWMERVVLRNYCIVATLVSGNRLKNSEIYLAVYNSICSLVEKIWKETFIFDRRCV